VIRLLVVQNDPDKGFGRVGEAVTRTGAVADTHLSSGALPPVAGYDGVVVLPGLADPGDDDPAIHRGRATIAAALEAGLPVLGICLGGQLLAQALGGETYRSAAEVGYLPVATTADAAADPLLGGVPQTFTPFHAHAYAFRSPPGSTVLARTAACDQAFRHGEAWGFQFHPETTIAFATGLANGLRGVGGGVDPATVPFFAANGLDPDALEADAHRLDADSASVATAIGAGFVARCRSQASAISGR
jgi:GMP synthase (glutamine-hydrolysing)